MNANVNNKWRGLTFQTTLWSSFTLMVKKHVSKISPRLFGFFKNPTARAQVGEPTRRRFRIWFQTRKLYFMLLLNLIRDQSLWSASKFLYSLVPVSFDIHIQKSYPRMIQVEQRAQRNLQRNLQRNIQRKTFRETQPLLLEVTPGLILF